MKKIILAAALLVTVGSTFASTFTVASTLSNAKKGPLRPSHNDAAVATFNAMYPGATFAYWKAKGEGVYQVSFIYNGVQMTAKYDYTGAYLGK